MKEARIVLPSATNAGKPLDEVHRDLRMRLAEIFGGFTAVKADGGWADGGKLYLEPVTVYDVAMEPSRENADKLDTLAQWVKLAAEQLAVYVRHANGAVVFA